ncbi:MAG: hypothetical protein NC038_03145 [Paludibacter sp.]|nr:hypothetical protein [Bacteroidales bacterium]MCM1069134.1 hypothetical protein [Prevotella sp.]MCM1353573.1 hypothetical protein [Bacteroides sp.]MCM1442734.1 hypothetical protein [Muribaculum sp.]MCM1481630.1 hypothetical protein [Paludibacter sp.]
MKRNFSKLVLGVIVSVFTLSCNTHTVGPVDSIEKGNSIIGHWEECDPVDVQYQPITPEFIEQLYIESDNTWQTFHDGELYDWGTYTTGHCDDYIFENESYGAQDSIVFVGQNATTVEFYVYNSNEDKLYYTWHPAAVGQPFKCWKRIK